MRIVNPVGKKGEDEAVKFLKKKGYKILDQNFRKNYGEVDIIATYDDILVFIEVKTRTSNQFGTPFEAITSWKMKSLLKIAQLYSAMHPKLPKALRIDAIAILLNSNLDVISIDHMENISG